MRLFKVKYSTTYLLSLTLLLLLLLLLLQKVIQNAQIDELGRRVIDVPASKETVEHARKALIYLWKEQRSIKARYPNPASNPRLDAILKQAFTEYGTRLVYDSATPGEIRTDTCSIRDPYTEGEFIRMSSFTWRMLAPVQEEGKRAYNRSLRFPHHRERLCILGRHHMLLRDEDIRNLNLSDTFNIQFRRKSPGSRLAMGLVFCIHRGKTNKNGTLLYATAFRHLNFLRCTVGAFAFYMLERFQASANYAYIMNLIIFY